MIRLVQIHIAGVRRDFVVLMHGVKRRVYEIVSSERKMTAQMVAARPPVDAMVLRKLDHRG